ncbi:hypothetical protein ACVWZ6_001636 [Bradyrhizobium sp. GM6.1]
MNPIFSPDGQGWPKFPKRSYGKLDQIEPLDPAHASQAVFCIDVIDAAWPQFANGGLFDLSNPPRLQSIFSDYWNLLFTGQVPPLDPFDDAPIYRIEITSEPGDPWFKELLTLGEDEWVTIELDDTGSFEVDVYGALLAAPVFAHLKRIERNIPESTALNVSFSPASWPDATKAELTAPLASLPALQYLIGLDVGQGAAVGLADANQDIQLYFDLGGGVYRNAKTRPNPLRFCWRCDAPIVLSHWDSDHWAGEITDKRAQPRMWIAPRQSMTKKHIAFANRILRAGGKLLIWGTSPASISVPIGGAQTLELRRCGPASTRNGSGNSRHRRKCRRSMALDRGCRLPRSRCVADVADRHRRPPSRRRYGRQECGAVETLRVHPAILFVRSRKPSRTKETWRSAPDGGRHGGTRRVGAWSVDRGDARPCQSWCGRSRERYPSGFTSRRRRHRLVVRSHRSS